MGLPKTYTSLCRSCENCLHAGHGIEKGSWVCVKDIDFSHEEFTDEFCKAQAVSLHGSCDDFEWCDEAEAQIRIELDRRFGR